MSDAIFWRKVERTAHIFIVPYTLIVTTISLVLKTFNPLPGFNRYSAGSACYFAKYPMGCNESPELVGECKRGGYALLMAQFSTHGMFVICFIGVVVLMGLLIRHAYWTEKTFRLNHNGRHEHVERTMEEGGRRGTETGTETETGTGTEIEVGGGDENQNQQRSCFCCGKGKSRIFRCCFNLEDFYQRQGEGDADYVLRLYRRETIIQAILYVSAFFTLYIAFAVLFSRNVLGWNMPHVVYTIFLNGLYPIMGLFNIIIYTRPKIQKFRMSNPNFSWIKSFFLVLKAGGEVPDIQSNEFATSFCCRCWYVDRHHDGISDVSFPTLPRYKVGVADLMKKKTGGRGAAAGSADINLGSDSQGRTSQKNAIDSCNNGDHKEDNISYSGETSKKSTVGSLPTQGGQNLSKIPGKHRSNIHLEDQSCISISGHESTHTNNKSPGGRSFFHNLSMSISQFLSSIDANADSSAEVVSTASSGSSELDAKKSDSDDKGEEQKEDSFVDNT